MISAMSPSEKEEHILAVLRAGERDDELLAQNLRVLDPYRGQWVVTHEGKVVAHSTDGAEAARLAPAAVYLGSQLRYVPTNEERRGVFVSFF